jgi:hypothetical protein
MTPVDGDVVDTNINRQPPALHSTVSQTAVVGRLTDLIPKQKVNKSAEFPR